MTHFVKNIQQLSTLTPKNNSNPHSIYFNDEITNSFLFDEESQNSFENISLLRLQIQQLRKQNAFLKKKIQQLNRMEKTAKTQISKNLSEQSINFKRKNPHLQQQKNSVEASVFFIITEIQSILKSLALVFRVEIDQKLWVDLQSSDSFEYYKSGTKCMGSDPFFTLQMNKKLQLIALEKEEDRYFSLLEVFVSYYKLKSGEELNNKNKIQNHISKILEISQKLTENFLKKQKKFGRSTSLKSSAGRVADGKYGSIKSINTQNTDRFNRTPLGSPKTNCYFSNHIPDTHTIKFIMQKQREIEVANFEDKKLEYQSHCF